MLENESDPPTHGGSVPSDIPVAAKDCQPNGKTTTITQTQTKTQRHTSMRPLATGFAKLSFSNINIAIPAIKERVTTGLKLVMTGNYKTNPG